MATHSGILAWRIPWTEQPGGLQSMGSQRVRHDWATSLSLLTFMHWRRKWQPTPVFLPEEFHGQRSLKGYSPWSRKVSNMTEWLTLSTRLSMSFFFEEKQLKLQEHRNKTLKKRLKCNKQLWVKKPVFFLLIVLDFSVLGVLQYLYNVSKCQFVFIVASCSSCPS